MRILIAPDKFKGSLDAMEAAEAIGRGVGRALPGAEIRLLPIADGGEGTAEAIHAAGGGEWRECPAHDALGREITARYLWITGSAALIEMSEASGMWRIPAHERNPLRASTLGTGELMRDAMRLGAKQIIVGLGGSATNDGGMGMAAALGYRFLTSDGEPLDPIPENLLALTNIRVPDIALPEIVAACDVRNPLLGPRGASRTFGPQKGADARMVEFLESGLENLADVAAHDLGCDFRGAPGAGAAGGLGFGLLTFCHARFRPGFDLVAEFLDLEEAVAGADLVITGEGSLDPQTLEGKAPAGIARLAQKHGKPVVALVGNIAPDAKSRGIFHAAHAIAQHGMPLTESMRDAANLLEQCAMRSAKLPPFL